MPVVSIRLPIGAIATPPRTPYATLTGPGARQRLRGRISNRHPVDLDIRPWSTRIHIHRAAHCTKPLLLGIAPPPTIDFLDPKSTFPTNTRNT